MKNTKQGGTEITYFSAALTFLSKIHRTVFICVVLSGLLLQSLPHGIGVS